jgi:hypothetical protein
MKYLNVTSDNFYPALRLTRHLVVIILVLLVASCTRQKDETRIDKSFLTDEPCPPPCWYGLKVGESSEEEVREAVSSLQFIRSSSIREWGAVWINDKSAEEIIWSCYQIDKTLCGGALVSNDRLKRIWFIVGYSMNLSEVVSKLGHPAYVDYGFVGVEVLGCEITMYWPEKLIAVSSIDERKISLCENLDDGQGLDPSRLADTIYYYVEDGFSDEPGGCCARLAWPGFID